MKYIQYWYPILFLFGLYLVVTGEVSAQTAAILIIIGVIFDFGLEAFKEKNIWQKVKGLVGLKS